VSQAHLETSLQRGVLSRAAVVGATLPALGKLGGLFASLGAEAVLVTGAEEIPEAHLLVALSPATRQLMLIGDFALRRRGTACRRLGLPQVCE